MTAAPQETQIATASGTFALGGDLPVVRLGYGAMQLTGPGIWGDPADPNECVRVLRRAVELGVTFIDTADSYGPFVSEQLIKRALHPYADDLVIATKAGLTRAGPGDWRALGRPEYLRQQCELSLRHLGLERIDLYQLHRIDPRVAVEDQLGELVAAPARGQDPAHRAVRGHRRGTGGGPRVTNIVAACRTCTTWPTARPRRCSTTPRRTASGSSRGSRWRPAISPGRQPARRAAAAEHGASPSQLALAWLLGARR